MTRFALLFTLTLIAQVLMTQDLHAHEQPQPEAPGTLSVQGEGTVTYSPDRASVTFAIESRKPTVAAAQKEAGDVAAAVLKLTERLGIPDKRVDTTGVSVRPDYVWDREAQENRLKGYVATRSMHVTVHKLDQLGLLIEGGVEAGVNQISPPTTFSSKARAHYRDALAAAAGDARKNAERLADALGVSLGSAKSVNASSNRPSPIPRPMMRAQAMEADAASATYSAGDGEISATVHVVFEIERE